MKFYLIAASVFGLDEWLKRKAEKRQENGDREVCFHRIILRKHHNKGFCLNRMDDKQPLVAALSAALTTGLAFRIFHIRKDASQRGYAMGLSLMLGGALSNTWDRLHRGYVVDYFSFQSKWKRLQDIIFNVSDLFIFLGAFIAVNFYQHNSRNHIRNRQI